VAGEEPVVDGGADVADVDVAGRARRETGADGGAHDVGSFLDGLRRVARFPPRRKHRASAGAEERRALPRPRQRMGLHQPGIGLGCGT